MKGTLVLFLLAATAATAQDRKRPDKKPAGPTLTGAVPLTAEPGKTTKLTVRGLSLDGLTAVRAADPTAKVKLLGPPKKAAVPNNHPAERIGDWAAEVELELDKGTPAGTLALTVVGPAGESNPIKVAVADGTPRVAGAEPNEGFTTAQAVTVPCVVEGVIGRDRDVDVVRFTGKAGAKLRVEVQAARLGSPLDALLTVYDAGGRTVASADDTDGSPDPVLTVTLPRDGTYYVAVIDAHDLGGPAFAYRLVLTPGPP